MFGSYACNPPLDSLETYFCSGAVVMHHACVFACSLRVAAESELVSLLNGEHHRPVSMSIGNKYTVCPNVN